MGITTDIIRYNVNELGRSHSGQKRAFNVAALSRLVNGAAAQEAVRNGDMVGYLGHDIRRQFGLRPPEVALDQGRLIPIEPAFTTVHLKAHDDGTIEHQARFLDTPLGQVAQEWHQAKTGGFSSVVAPDERQPTDFLGFDYVRSPNFNRNRGYVMDSTEEDWAHLTNKQKIELLQAHQQEHSAVFDALVTTILQLNQAGHCQNQQAAHMLDLIDTMQAEQQEQAWQLRDAQALVERHTPPHEPMLRLSVGAGNWLTGALASFDAHEVQPAQANRLKTAPPDVLKYFR